jgi:anthranilate/para-aminobenzoate synthase component II
MILLINICKEKLHYLEFVKPIEDILRKNKIAFFVKGFKEVQQKELDKATKVIICGTSLWDNDFALTENLRFFNWIPTFNKPLLGICGGMQMIGRMFKCKLLKETEIGFFKERFHKEFLGLTDWQEVYHLHNYYVDFNYIDSFETFAISDKEIVQAVKHATKDIYGVLFHPEVRQKMLISNFAKLK